MPSRSAPTGDLARLNLACAKPKQRSSLMPACPIALGTTHHLRAQANYTGYAAVVIPGVNEAIDAKNSMPSPRSNWPS
jgi:hypothetical protein